MNQIPSLKVLDYSSRSRSFWIDIATIGNIPFVSFPGARGCLMHLSELKCNSDIHSNHFYQLSRICQNIQSLVVILRNRVSDGLKDFIVSQRSLKSFGLDVLDNQWRHMRPALSGLHNTITRLHIGNWGHDVDLTFITSFRELRELVISSSHVHDELRHLILPNLQTFRYLFVPYGLPTLDPFIQFLKNNGKNLDDLYINYAGDQAVNLSIIRHCPNLKRLTIVIKKGESVILKNIFNGCQDLESIKVWC